MKTGDVIRSRAARFRIKNTLFAAGLGKPLHVWTPVFPIGNDQSLTQSDQSLRTL
jgi:hypothetical protein